MTKEQTALDIARRMAELGERSHAVTAYTLALADARDRQPETELEAALYLFENGGNYKVAYDAFRSLYRRGFQRETLLELMTQAFYQPNIKLLKSRYEKNCRLLRKYPYCFQQDFPAFEELPLRFYPYDDQRYIPFTVETETFGEPLDLRHPVVSRNFFQNLDKPVLAADVYSQYELEYLRDNVRKSEWVGRENHVYLHYTDWGIFCAYLQVLNLRPLLEEEKLVFLIEDEISQYPIDFKSRFGIDYSQYPVKPVGIREIHRLIWHTQLSSHNGGDFFNEIFDNHPNLIAVESVMLYHLRDQVEKFRKLLDGGGTITFDSVIGDGDLEKPQRLANQLSRLHNRTDKDIFVALYLAMADLRNLDPGIEALLVALDEGLFFDPDIDFLVIWNMLPVPAAHSVKHGDGAAHHVDTLVGEQPAHPEDPARPAQALIVGVAHILAEGHPDFVPIQIDRIGLGVFEPLVEQAAHGRLPRPRQAGEKVYGSLVFHVLLLSDTAAVPAAPGPAPKGA